MAIQPDLAEAVTDGRGPDPGAGADGPGRDRPTTRHRRARGAVVDRAARLARTARGAGVFVVLVQVHKPLAADEQADRELTASFVSRRDLACGCAVQACPADGRASIFHATGFGQRGQGPVGHGKRIVTGIPCSQGTATGLSARPAARSRGLWARRLRTTSMPLGVIVTSRDRSHSLGDRATQCASAPPSHRYPRDQQIGGSTRRDGPVVGGQRADLRCLTHGGDDTRAQGGSQAGERAVHDAQHRPAGQQGPGAVAPGPARSQDPSDASAPPTARWTERAAGSRLPRWSAHLDWTALRAYSPRGRPGAASTWP